MGIIRDNRKLLSELGHSSADPEAHQVSIPDATTEFFPPLYIDQVNNRVGVNIVPNRAVEIFDASAPQVRLTQDDGVDFTDFQTDGSGNMTITSSGGDIILNAEVFIGPDTSGNGELSLRRTATSDDAVILFDTGINTRAFIELDSSDHLVIDADNNITLDAGDDVILAPGTGDHIDVQGIIDFTVAMGGSAQDPTTDAPNDWVEVEIGGVTYYLPAYT